MLARYFHGRNGPEKSMELTCPIKLWVEFGKEAYGPWSDGEVVASLHLPYDCVSRPPAPVDSNLFIQEMPEHFAYVASFEGFATENMWHEEIVKLRRVLDGEGMNTTRNLSLWQDTKISCTWERKETKFYLLSTTNSRNFP